MRSIGFIIGATSLVAIVIVALVATFIRETSGIEERWQGKTQAEREAFMAPILALAASPNYQSNVAPGTNSRPHGGDHDGDGIPDDEETGNGNPLGPGTDPTNPDTDGDGISDRLERQRGTNPNDPADGGITPAPPETTPAPVSNDLIVDNLYKVLSPNDDNYDHFAEINLNETVHFRIHVEVINEGGSHQLLIEDQLPASFTYLSGAIATSRTSSRPLTVEQLRHQVLTITEVGRTVIDINFVIQATGVGAFENTASAVADGDIGGLTDTAYVKVNAPLGGSPNDLIPCTLCNFFVLGRNGSQSPWGTNVTTSTGDTLDFYLSAETANQTGRAQTIKILDSLPLGLTYVSGSGKLITNRLGLTTKLSDEWILHGLSLTTLPPGTRFEIYFSAKVEAAGSFTLTDTAKAEDWSTPPVNKEAAVQIKSR